MDESVIQTILTEHFPILPNDFDWNKPLEELHPDFGVLGILLDLEILLNNHFEKDISLVNQIDPTFNTPNDIVILINNKLL